MESVTGEMGLGGLTPEQQKASDEEKKRLESIADFHERMNQRIRDMALQRIADVEQRELAALDVKHRQEMLALEELKASEEDKAKLQRVYERERFDLQTEHANKRAEDDKKRINDEAEKRKQELASAPKQGSNISGMFRASAIALAGRGASPEQKSLEQLKGIYKETTAQRRLAQRQALAAERLNVALTHG
jgi:hypothetical protein